MCSKCHSTSLQSTSASSKDCHRYFCVTATYKRSKHDGVYLYAADYFNSTKKLSLLQLLRAIFFDSIGMINLNSFRFFTVLFTLLLFAHTCIAQRGKDGNKTIFGNTKVNEYTVLTANASTGDTILQVQSSSLNANNRFSGILAAGDLLMVVGVGLQLITTVEITSSYK
jgi:hypothetical protein